MDCGCGCGCGLWLLLAWSLGKGEGEMGGWMDGQMDIGNGADDGRVAEIFAFFFFFFFFFFFLRGIRLLLSRFSWFI